VAIKKENNNFRSKCHKKTTDLDHTNSEHDSGGDSTTCELRGMMPRVSSKSPKSRDADRIKSNKIKKLLELFSDSESESESVTCEPRGMMPGVSSKSPSDRGADSIRSKLKKCDKQKPNIPKDVIVKRASRLNGCTLPVQLNGVTTRALVDTGATHCLVSRSVFDAMEPGIRKLLRTESPPTIRGIGGLTMSALGILTVCVKIYDHEWPIDMVIQPGDEIVGCLLGFDFFQMYGCALSMKDACFEIEGIKFKMNAEYKHDMCARVRVEESIVIPARSELVITGIPDAKIKHFPGVQCSTEPAYYAQELSSEGLSVGGSLFFNGTAHVPVPVVNPTSRPVHIQKGRVIAIALPVHHTTEYAQTSFGQEHDANECIIASAPQECVHSTADGSTKLGAPVLH
jgi:predicted aspartyl protease